VSKEAKTGIGLAIVALLALAVYRSMSLLAALAVLVVGAVAAIYVLRKMDEDGGMPRRKQSTTERLEAATSGVQPLAPWSPPESLKPWSPPSDLAQPETDEFSSTPPVTDFAAAPPESTETDDFWAPTETEPSDFSDLAPPADQPSSWLDDPFAAPTTDEPTTDDPWSSTDQPWADGSTWDRTNVAADTNPLDELSRLDGVDVIAEFERLETSDTFTEPELDVAPILDELATPINEAVSSDDDILAASSATELQIGAEGENSELAKLLAKVQARLAAYE
jgi:hypothetical protein